MGLLRSSVSAEACVTAQEKLRNAAFTIADQLSFRSFTNTFLSSAFLAEPSFVFADVIGDGGNRVDGEDDKIYYFFTEVSVEYEFFGKLLIPRVARVCKVSLRHAPSAHAGGVRL